MYYIIKEQIINIVYNKWNANNFHLFLSNLSPILASSETP